ncbi:MAG: GGDEF domain-containing protein [Myxococcota bacterium]|nr:GGDEF domain-containing protein [Myxococcota bacterium]
MSLTEASIDTEPESSRDETANIALLVTIRGPKLGQRRILDPLTKGIRLGRDEGADIPLNDDSVSRFHCEIIREESGWFITDLGSTNGTYLGHQVVDRAPIENGDLIKVGATIFKFLSTKDIESAFHEEIYRIAIIDGLTQIYNSRYLDEFLNREISRCRRHGRPMSLIMFDLDGFEEINEQFGQLSGDHVLKFIAGKLNRRIRREELFARYRADEFVVALPETDLDDALKFADIIRESVEIMPIAFDGWKIPVSISVGVGRFDHKMTKASELLDNAHDALNRAKAKGRNQVSS